MKHNNKLSTLQARTILFFVDSITLISVSDLQKQAETLVNDLIALYPTIFNSADKLVYLAFLLSRLYIKALELKKLNTIEYIQLYAEHKKLMFERFNDLGAFCDLYEILVRIAFIGNINLLKPYHLIVKPILSVDLISKKYGKIEIGFNGKTLQEGILTDYMYGKYDTLVYGVIDDYTRDLIVNACIKGDLMQAVKIIKAYTIIINKYDFIPTLEQYRRGKIVAVKSNKIMIQYNASLYNCVMSAIDAGDLITLETIL